MSPVILMAAIAVSQCRGGSCSPVRVAPSYRPSVSVPVASPAYAPTIRVVDRPAPPPLRRFAIKHEGLRFTVYGVQDADGTVEWSPDLDVNARAYAAARAASQEKPAVAAEKPEIQNFGLSPDKMGHNKDEYTTRSDEAKRFVQEAKGEAGGPGMLHVTVIGSEADCAPVLNDLKSNPALASVRDRLMVQDYRANEWPVDPKLGFQVNGKPTILIQSARGPGDAKGGRVVYRQMDYAGGAEHLAEEIRKSDPHYDPANDPGPGRAGRGGCPLGFTHEHWIVIAGAAVIVLFVFSKPKVKP